MPTGLVRALERALLLERAEAIVPQIVREYLEDWDPDDRLYPLDLGIRIRAAGITLPGHYGQALTYLERCQRDNVVPNPKPLTYALLPWTARL